MRVVSDDPFQFNEILTLHQNRLTCGLFNI